MFYLFCKLYFTLHLKWDICANGAYSWDNRFIEGLGAGFKLSLNSCHGPLSNYLVALQMTGLRRMKLQQYV